MICFTNIKILEIEFPKEFHVIWSQSPPLLDRLATMQTPPLKANRDVEACAPRRSQGQPFRPWCPKSSSSALGKGSQGPFCLISQLKLQNRVGECEREPCLSPAPSDFPDYTVCSREKKRNQEVTENTLGSRASTRHSPRLDSTQRRRIQVPLPSSFTGHRVRGVLCGRGVPEGSESTHSLLHFPTT